MKTASTPTLQDIADAANVSTATVSRVINNPENVRPALRVLVQAQIDALGYVRHGAARALASSKSYTIGALIPTLESAIFASGVNAIESVLVEAGYTLLLAVTNYDPDQEHRQIQKLIEQGVDGLILFGRDHTPETLELLHRQQCPFVMTWTYSDNSTLPCIGFDNVAASNDVGNHLIGLGHTRIGVIAGITTGNDRARERVAGIRDALVTHGLQLHPHHVIEQPYELTGGREGLRQLMDLPSDKRPTAIFCGNDVLAIGAMLEAQHRGILIPNDLSIVGFDDLPMAEHLPPGLTTVHVPSKRMGAEAARYILNTATGKPIEDRVQLSTNLVLRGTTAAPPKV